MADDEKDKKCKHAGCNCRADAGSDYCGLYCENAEDMSVTELACGCEHAGCGT